MLPAYSPGGTLPKRPGSLRATAIVPGNGLSGITTPGRNSVHPVEVEIKILDLAIRIECRKFAEHAGNVEVRGVGAGHDLVERHLQHIARLRFLDIDGPGQRVRPTAGKIRARFFDLFDRRARDYLIVAVHHGFEDDGVTGIHPKYGRLRTVEPAPLGGVERRRQQMHLLAVRQIHDAELEIGRPDAGIAGRGDRRGWRELRRGGGSGWRRCLRERRWARNRCAENRCAKNESPAGAECDARR